ncbi:MAG: hypothetical protein NVS1B7_6340 [Candidatus Saccharimonadales bacterium]
MSSVQPIFNRIFKDDHNRIVVTQWPNVPLAGFIISKILSLVLSSYKLKHGFVQLGTAFIFAWALLEITQGVNYFRRIFGLTVLIAVLLGFFK